MIAAGNDLRPLDRFGSLKIKLGVLIVVTVTLATVIAAVGVRLGLLPAYTIPLAVITALLVTQVLARGMTSPIRDMTAAARAMADGDYSRRVPSTSADEVGDLARAFNQMSSELERVEQQRRDLVANVSHELRTPISALHAVLENLVDGVSEPDPTTLRVALAQTERLGRLVTDLLDLSRVDAGIAPLHRWSVPIGELLHRVAAEARMGEGPDHPVRLEVDVADPELTVDGDRERLHQLMANLVDNASRHSGPAGRVVLRARPAGDQVVIDVLDTGPGIPPAEREAVFERFHTRGHSGDGGTGLGLAIARWVTVLHGGTIVVAVASLDEAPEPRGGCDIRVTLPRGTQPATAPASPPDPGA